MTTAGLLDDNINASSNTQNQYNAGKVDDDVSEGRRTIDLDEDDNMVEDIEEAIEKSGGCSKFQAFAFTWIVFGMAAGAFILYSISYFEL